jgi:hypothetical protein
VVPPGSPLYLFCRKGPWEWIILPWSLNASPLAFVLLDDSNKVCFLELESGLCAEPLGWAVWGLTAALGCPWVPSGLPAPGRPLATTRWAPLARHGGTCNTRSSQQLGRLTLEKRKFRAQPGLQGETPSHAHTEKWVLCLTLPCH